MPLPKITDMRIVFGATLFTWVFATIATFAGSGGASLMSIYSTLPGGAKFGMLLVIVSWLIYMGLVVITAMMAFKPGGFSAGKAKPWVIAAVAEGLMGVGFIATAASVPWIAAVTFQLLTGLIVGPFLVVLLHPRGMGAEDGGYGDTSSNPYADPSPAGAAGGYQGDLAQA